VLYSSSVRRGVHLIVSRLSLSVFLLSLSFVPTIGATVEASTTKPQAKRSTTRTTPPAKRSTTQTAKKKAPAKRYSAKASRARRLKLAAARARAIELAELAKPIFKLDERGREVPHVRAAAAIVYDPVTGEVIWEENSQELRSIASITKLMTAVVFLERAPDLSSEVMIERGDVTHASVTHLRANERVRLDDLLHLMLISSDNGAARALARVSPMGSAGFVDRMNSLAKELGLDHSSFADPSGLYSSNVSSAYDLSRLIAFVATDERIAPILRKRDYTLTTSRRTVTVRSTNKLLGEVDVKGGKTGFIGKSGYCFASLLRLPHGRDVAVVVLGAKSSAGRFLETRHLFNWMSLKAKALIGQPPLILPPPQEQN